MGSQNTKRDRSPIRSRKTEIRTAAPNLLGSERRHISNLAATRRACKIAPIYRKRKMRTKFFLHKLFEHRQGSGTSRQNSRDIPDSSLQTQGRQSFEGGHEVFNHHPFAWKTPTPPGGLRTQKLNLCALFSCLNLPKRRTNVQPLTCKIDSSNSFYYLFFSFIILELKQKPLVLKGKVRGEKWWKNAKKCEKVRKIMKRFCPLVVAL